MSDPVLVMPIEFNQGLEVNRAITLFKSGEPAWTTDEHGFFIGDGVTVGGIRIGAGNIVGPISSLDSHIAVFDGVTGKLLKDSGKKVNDFVWRDSAVSLLTNDVGYVTALDLPTKISQLQNDSGFINNLPIASNDLLGLVKGFNNLTISDAGALSLTNINIIAALGFTPANATTSVTTDTAQTFTAPQRSAIVQLTDGPTITPDLDLGNDFMITISGNRSLTNPDNIIAAVGQKGVIIIKQDTLGSRLVIFGSFYNFGSSGIPTLSTSPDKEDRIQYHIISPTNIHCTFIGGF